MQIRLVIVVVALVAGCGSGEASPRSEVLVSAASSLADVFGEMESVFESAHPDLDLVVNTGGSSALVAQIVDGAPIDVFASADRATMDELVRAGNIVGDPIDMATNALQVAVPADNPGGVTGVDDLSRDDLLIGLCAVEVPCGALAREALARAGVEAAVDTDEPSARALLGKLTAGELEAAITYVTDVDSSGGSVRGIDLPASAQVRTVYSIATVAGAPNAEGGRAFVEFVRSDAGQAILGEYGFGSP